jgi:hypothetical protein
MDITTQILGKLTVMNFMLNILLLFAVTWLWSDSKEEHRKDFLHYTILFTIITVILHLF